MSVFGRSRRRGICVLVTGPFDDLLHSLPCRLPVGRSAEGLQALLNSGLNLCGRRDHCGIAFLYRFPEPDEVTEIVIRESRPRLPKRLLHRRIGRRAHLRRSSPCRESRSWPAPRSIAVARGRPREPVPQTFESFDECRHAIYLGFPGFSRKASSDSQVVSYSPPRRLFNNR